MIASGVETLYVIGKESSSDTLTDSVYHQEGAEPSMTGAH